MPETPLPRKLGIKDGHRVALQGAPDGFEEQLGPPPVTLITRQPDRGPYHVIVLFAERLSELEREFRRLYWRIASNGGVWIAYPKKASGKESDIDFEAVQHLGLESGLVDNKMCAIDEVWTAVRFVVRRQDRAGWPP